MTNQPHTPQSNTPNRTDEKKTVLPEGKKPETAKDNRNTTRPEDAARNNL